MLEHDENWAGSLTRMAELVKDDGMLLFTCATTGRPEHGTKRTTPQDSPATTDYYLNITEEMVRSIPGFLDQFKFYRFSVNNESHDLQFYGIKGRALFTPSLLTWIETYLSYWWNRRIRDYRNAFLKLKLNLWHS